MSADPSGFGRSNLDRETGLDVVLRDGLVGLQCGDVGLEKNPVVDAEPASVEGWTEPAAISFER